MDSRKHGSRRPFSSGHRSGCEQKYQRPCSGVRVCRCRCRRREKRAAATPQSNTHLERIERAGLAHDGDGACNKLRRGRHLGFAWGDGSFLVAASEKYVFGSVTNPTQASLRALCALCCLRPTYHAGYAFHFPLRATRLQTSGIPSSINPSSGDLQILHFLFSPSLLPVSRLQSRLATMKSSGT